MFSVQCCIVVHHRRRPAAIKMELIGTTIIHNILITIVHIFARMCEMLRIRKEYRYLNISACKSTENREGYLLVNVLKIKTLIPVLMFNKL